MGRLRPAVAARRARLYRPAWSAEILDEVVDSLTERMPEHAERFQRRRERMEAAFAEATAQPPGGFLAAVPDEVDAGDRHVVAGGARRPCRRHGDQQHPALAPERLAESGLLVQTADEFLIHQWWLDPQGVDRVLAEMAAGTTRRPLTVAQVLESLGRLAPEFVSLVEQHPAPDGGD